MTDIVGEDFPNCLRVITTQGPPNSDGQTWVHMTDYQHVKQRVMALRTAIDAAEARHPTVAEAARVLRAWADATDWEHNNEFELFTQHLIRAAIAGGDA